MKIRAVVIVLGILLLGLSGCGGGDDNPTTPDGTSAPAITGVTPATVTVGTTVTVSGAHFGTTGQLLVNGTEVATTSWSDTSIVFTVPAGITGTEIQVRVRVGGQDSSDFAVTFTAPTTMPTITSVDPTGWTEGLVALIYGQNFGTTGLLEINGEAAATTTWTDNLIVFTVPTGIYGSQVMITVTSGGQTSAQYSVPFTEATERQLTFDGMGCDYPCWSADGQTIYFTANAPDGTRAFYQVPFDGGETTLLYNGPGNNFMLDVQYYQAGDVIWVTDRTDGANYGGDWEIREGSAGFNPQGYVDPDHASNTSNERFPVWSHTERLNVDCAWSQDRLAGNSWIYIRRLATPIPLVSGVMPCFNPGNGEYLAYLTPSPTYGYDIMTIRAEEGAVGELLYRDEQTSQTGLAWGNAGQIAYKRGYHIWIMDEDGTNHRKLTNGTDQETQPRFSPSGTWVVFSRLVTTEYEVFVARVPY